MIARLAALGLHLLLVVGVTFACAGSAGGAGWKRALLILPALVSLVPLPLLVSVALSLHVSMALLLLLLLSRRLNSAGWH